MIGSTDALEISTELLPFRVELARAAELPQVAKVRTLAYGRHLPEFAMHLCEPEDADVEPGCEVFVARSKLDGSVIGTFRLHTNAFRPLPLQASVDLPDSYQGCRMIEAVRLCVLGGLNSSVVRSAMFKALYLYCLREDVRWMVIVGRRPMDRFYESLSFADVLEPNAFYPMAHGCGIPHRVMSLPTAEIEPRCVKRRHALLNFIFQTRHPDIDLSRARDLRSFKWYGEQGERVGTAFDLPARSSPSIEMTFPLRGLYSGAVSMTA